MSRSRTTYGIFTLMVHLLLMSQQALAQNMLVCDERGGRVLRYELSSGEIIDHFVGAGLDSLGGIVDLTIDPTGQELYVTSASSGVWRYDAQTGRRLGRIIRKTFRDNIRGATFGPDGMLYVCQASTHEVLKYTPLGGFLGVAVAARSGGLHQPWRGILFDHDGNLLVASLGTHNVLRFDGETGAFIDEFVPASSGLQDPTGMAMDDEGRLYVCSFRGTSVVVRDPDGTIRPLWPDGEPRVRWCEDIEFIENGRLLITSSSSSALYASLFEVDTTGVIVREIIPDGEMPTDSYKFVATVIQPSPEQGCRADFDGDGELTIFDFLAFQNAFAAGCP